MTANDGKLHSQMQSSKINHWSSDQTKQQLTIMCHTYEYPQGNKSDRGGKWGANSRLYMPALCRLYMPVFCRLYMQGFYASFKQGLKKTSQPPKHPNLKTKCPVCGMPCVQAKRMSSRPHPETPKPPKPENQVSCLWHAMCSSEMNVITTPPRNPKTRNPQNPKPKTPNPQ